MNQTLWSRYPTLFAMGLALLSICGIVGLLSVDGTLRCIAWILVLMPIGLGACAYGMPERSIRRSPRT